LLNNKYNLDFILLDQVESDKNNEEAVNQHIWSVDTFINNSNEEKLSKREALTMLWNIYALLILNNEHNKPVLTFQTIEMIKGRLHQRNLLINYIINLS